MNEQIDIDDAAPYLIVLITLAGGVLRVLLLATKGMWTDETFSVWMASQSVANMLQWIVRIDQHPPLYYLLLHYWLALNGNTPYYARLLSALFGAATIPVIYLIGKRMAGTVMGLSAAVLLTFSLFNIYYAQETRMYTLLTFNATVAIYALVRLLTDPRSVRPIGSQFRDYLRAWRTPGPVEPDPTEEFSYKNEVRKQSGWRAWILRHRWLPIQAIETDLAWVAFIVFSAVTLFSHNTAVLFPLTTNIFVLGLMLFQRTKKSGALPSFQAPSLWNWAKAQIGILILWIPWLIPFIRQASGVYQRFWIPQPTWDAFSQLLSSFFNLTWAIPANLATVVWSVYGLVFCLALVHYRKKISQFLFLVALFAIPFLGELFVSIWRPIFYGRTLIWTTIPLLLVLAAGIAQLRARVLIFVVLACIGTFSLFSTGDYYHFYQKEDWYTAAGDVAGFTEKNDLVLFNSNLVEIPFNYYFLPFETHYYLQVVKRGVPQDLFESGILEPVMTAKDIPGLLALVSGHKRVWLVYSHESYTDPLGLIPQTLASHMKLTRDDEFYGGRVQLYIAQ